MQFLEVRVAVRPLYWSLGVKGLIHQVSGYCTNTTGMTHLRNPFERPLQHTGTWLAAA